jgi:sulfide:quinone oxidoreductase
MRSAIEELESGRVVFGILGHPFKCPPAPFEGALMLHDQLTRRGVRDAVEIEIFGPMKAPVPIVKEVSQAILEVLTERGIEYRAERLVVELDPDTKVARLKDGDEVSYDLFVGIPVHRVPEVVESSGLAVDGWVPVNPANLRTQFEGVYAAGDLVAIPMAKAGVFAEAAAAVVAEDIAARLHGKELEHPYEGAGTCYIEFGEGVLAKVEANFLGGPSPTARLVGPSADFADDKRQFAASRRERWFG